MVAHTKLLKVEPEYTKLARTSIEAAGQARTSRNIATKQQAVAKQLMAELWKFVFLGWMVHITETRIS